MLNIKKKGRDSVWTKPYIPPICKGSEPCNKFPDRFIPTTLPSAHWIPNISQALDSVFQLCDDSQKSPSVETYKAFKALRSAPNNPYFIIKPMKITGVNILSSFTPVPLHHKVILLAKCLMSHLSTEIFQITLYCNR